MKFLTQIIQSLKPGETRLIRNFYNIQNNGESKKRLELFDLVKTGKIKDDQEGAKLIYGEKPGSAYSHLKARLKNEISHFLLLQDSSKKYNSKFARAELDCRRMYMEGDIFIERGAYDEGVNLLTKAGELADKYELYNEQIMVNEILRAHLGVKKGIEEYESYSTRIEEALTSLKKLLTAKDYYHKIMVPNLFQRNKEKDFIGFAKNALIKLDEFYKDTRSAKIGYYYYYIGIFYYELINDLDLALAFSLQLLDLIKKEDAIFSKKRLAKANLEIGYLYIKNASYSDSIKYTENALANLKNGTTNELISIEVLFFACYRSGDFKRSGELIETAFDHAVFNSNKLNPAKWNYYKACLAFSIKDYEKALDILLESSELMKDKSGWLLGHKMLEIMVFLERNDEDIAYNRVEAFRKLLQRQKKENVQRVNAVVHILETLAKTGFDYHKTYKLEKDNFTKLKRSEGDYRWDPMGYEIVRFDEWFLTKIAVADVTNRQA